LREAGCRRRCADHRDEGCREHGFPSRAAHGFPRRKGDET
jgi:hypothetical protein